jgi:hypothetical protein
MHPYCQPASPASSLSVSSFFAAQLDGTCVNHKSAGATTTFIPRAIEALHRNDFRDAAPSSQPGDMDEEID